MSARQKAWVVFYQNDKTGKFVTHKEMFRPAVSELHTLIDDLARDGGTLGLRDDHVTHFYVFTNSAIIHEADPKDGKQNVERQHIIDRYCLRLP